MGTIMTRRSRFLLPAGLLMVTGLLASGRPVLAQTNVACPPTSNPGRPPSVTAQDVDNGTGSLKDFILAVRQNILESSPIHFGCVMRQEGGPLRSGSTYIVRLTPDGRIHTHGKNMGLSGRRLKPSIYQAILKGLGIEGGDRIAALTAAASRNGGSFAVPGGGGAYATVYLRRAASRAPFVLVAGFDLNASHVISFADEEIDYGNPSVTARDVVDQATLKDFVTQAGNWYKGRVDKEGLGSASSLRLAMRDPNGPWRHGSVYIYIWDVENRIILFHAGFPNTYELQPLRPVRRDAVTGQLILPQLLEAAKGPEGGFVEYHFDDPNDDDDSADIPKTGYVRRFLAEPLRPDGSKARWPFVVGSGFYRRPSQVSQNTVVAAVLPQIMRSVTASTVDAVSSRIEHATSNTAPSTAFSLGGASTLTGALQANGQGLADGAIDLGRLLANSSFTMPFNVADGSDGGAGEDSAPPLGQFTFWGSGDYRSISGGTPQSVSYDGSVTSANLGIDTRLGADVLAGVALLWSQGDVEYKASGASGDLTTRLVTVNPYLGWQISDGMDLWSMAGYGTGKLEIDDKSGNSQESDMNQRMFAAGVKGTLASSDSLIAGGATSLGFKGEVAFTWADVEGAGSLENTALQVGRQRLMVEGAHARKLDSGATFTSSLEVGVRNDTGDGETGAGAEVGGALRYEGAGSRLIVEGRVRTLLSHGGDTEETGVSALVRIKPGAAGRGLALALEPSWGRTASGVQHLWESGISAGASGGNQARLNGEVGYGFDAPQGLGVVTPYTGLALTGEGGSWRMGARWQVSDNRSVSLEATRHEAAKDDGPGHGLMLRGALHW